MQLNSSPISTTVNLFTFESLVNCRNQALGIDDKTLPAKYDAYDALQDGISYQMMEEVIEKSEICNIKKSLDNSDKKQNTVSIALDLCKEVKLFVNQDGDTYGIIIENSKTTVLKIKSLEFEKWIRNKYYKHINKPLNTNSVSEILATLDAQSYSNNLIEKTYKRVAKINGEIFIDTCNSKNEVVNISQSGYKIINNPRVNFIRNPSMRELPNPITGGSLNLLKKHLNSYVSENNFFLLVCWILQSLYGEHPYPILIISGEQGSGKSTLAKILRYLIDPSSAPLAFISDQERDLAVSAKTSHMVSFDNISHLSQGLSDMMCMLSTGGNYVKRKLLTDYEQINIDLSNPLLINGINFIPPFPDLLERSIIIETKQISSKDRKTEREIFNDFNADYSKILGFLYELLSHILNNISNVNLSVKTRLADFCELATAVEHPLGLKDEEFLKLFLVNQSDIAEESMSNNPFIEALRLFIDLKCKSNYIWQGTMTDLLRDLEQHFTKDSIYIKSLDWPKTVQKAGTILVRFKPLLNRVGYRIDKFKSDDRHRTRIIKIYKDK